jgi:hypothetical protein
MTLMFWGMTSPRPIFANCAPPSFSNPEICRFGMMVIFLITLDRRP